MIAGVTPAKARRTVAGVAAFDIVWHAVRATLAKARVIFVPGPYGANSISEAADAGVRSWCLSLRAFRPGTWPEDGLPAGRELVLVGLVSRSVITPGEAELGIHSGSIVQLGPVDMASHSGTLTYDTLIALSRRGIG